MPAGYCPLCPSAGGRRAATDPAEVVGAICCKLPTGCQWRWRPVNAFFTGEPLSWQGVCYPFNAWGKQGVWKKLGLTRLRLHRPALDLSSVQLDGSHALAQNGGAAIGCQGRKAGRTTNALFLVDNQGLPVAVATPREHQKVRGSRGQRLRRLTWEAVLAGEGHAPTTYCLTS